MKSFEITINKVWLFLFAVALVSFAGSHVGAVEGPYVSEPVTPHVFEGDLSQLAPAAAWKPGDPIREVPLLELGPGGYKQYNLGTDGQGASQTKDPAYQDVNSPFLMPSPTVSFDGIPFTGYYPPDTNGDVGPNHYILTVNVQFAIYSKTGALLVGPLPINSLWAGFGGRCQTDNDGDPIAMYDHLADRWIISQFVAFSNQCIAVSKGPNPVTDGWYLYDFSTGGVTNDYPKFGLWPDAYYMGSQRGYPGGGADAWAFDRAKMLNGQPATLVRFFDSGPFMLPSDLDGATVPPTGAPNVFARLMDSAEYGGSDRLELYEFHVDWTTPTNSTFTALPDLFTAAFDRELCSGYDLMGICIPQPGTSRTLESLTAWLMYRLQYRNFGSYQTLVVNHTVDVDATNHAGVRWYELRKTGSAWSIYQQGTYSPDAHHRWMGSVAMDKSGNMSLGYSISSSSVYPSIRYTGRLVSDPLGTMPQGEATLMAGTGSQTAQYRWGDYSAMSVDPVDDCTFWYTNQYVASDGRWRTRVGAFKFPSCGIPPVPWKHCVKDVLYTTQYCVNLEYDTRLIRGQALYPSQDFPAPITGTFKVNPNEAIFSVDYLNETGLRFYRINTATLTGESWGIRDSDSSYYDSPRSATLERCTCQPVEPVSEESGAVK